MDPTPTESSSQDTPPIRSAGWGALLILLVVWSVLFNIAGRFTWGWGPLSFAILLAAFFLLVFVRPLARNLERLAAGRVLFTTQGIELLVGVIIVVYVALDITAFVQEVQISRNATYLIDIAANTYEAGRWFFAEGANPYTHFSQVWDQLTPDIPNVTVEDGRVYLYGVPYYYGFPYFPMMFISFEPFRQLIDTYNAVRAGNLVYYFVTMGLIVLICRRLVRPGYRRIVSLLCVVTFLSTRVWSTELFHEGVVDIIIAVYGLAGFLMLAYRKPVLSGVFFGLAFGCKLLPAPFWFTLVTWWWWKDGGLRPAAIFATVFTLVSGVVILPFVAWDPQAFVSATILYFLTSQGAGDSTSLWYFLPDALKTPLLVIGGVWIGILFIRFFMKRAPTAVDTMQYAFLTYVSFIAFNKQTHLNHLWSIFAMGCIALIVMAFAAVDPAAEAGAAEDEIEPVQPAAVSG